MSLTQKTCVPCQGGIPPLTADEAKGFMDQVPGWALSDAGDSCTLVIPACCGIVTAGAYPTTSYGVPTIAATFASSPAFASGYASIRDLNEEPGQVMGGQEAQKAVQYSFQHDFPFLRCPLRHRFTGTCRQNQWQRTGRRLEIREFDGPGMDSRPDSHG